MFNIAGPYTTVSTREASLKRTIVAPSVLFTAAACCLIAAFPVRSQTLSLSDRAQQAGYSCIETGANTRVFMRIRAVTNSGVVSLQTNRFRLLTTGLNRWVSNRWVETRPELIITNTGIIARGAAHSAFFSANLNDTGSIQIKDSSGQWLKVHPLGLAYRDNSTGSNIYFATLKDSTAQVVGAGSNRVVYPDAFDGANRQRELFLHESRRVPRGPLSSPSAGPSITGTQPAFHASPCRLRGNTVGSTANRG